MKWASLAFIIAAPCLGAPPGAALRVEPAEDLDFGTLVTRDEPGSATLLPLGMVQSSGGVSRGPGIPRPGRLVMKGPAGAPFTVRFSPAPLLVGQGSAPPGISAFHAEAGAFDGAGHAVVPVGATLATHGGALPGRPAPATVWVTVETPTLAPVTVPLPVKVRFMATLQATVESALDFGDIVVPRADASVRLEPGGRRGPEGKVSLGTRDGSAARFQVQGEPGAPFSVVLPARVLLRGPGEPMELAAFASNLPSGRGVLAGGRARVGVGATLKVGGGQKPGVYRGTFQVSFAYE